MPHFTYNIVDINEISYELGIPWEASKDQPFATSTIYIGFVWNLAQCMITLSSNKTEKYINEINIWLERWTHSGSKKCPNVCMFSTKGNIPQHLLTWALTYEYIK